MPDVVVRIALLALAALFAWAAVVKILRFGAWRDALAGYGLGRAGEVAAAPAVPITEAVVAALLLFAPARAAAALALAVATAFSLAILRARERRGDELPCGCFGKTKARDFRLMLVRNASLGVLAGLVMLYGEGVSPLEGWRLPSTGELVPAILVIAGLTLALWTARQVVAPLRRGDGQS